MVFKINFSVLDEMLVREGDLFVYSHALVMPNDMAHVYTLTGKPGREFSYEDMIIKFLRLHLRDGQALYACRHYAMYPSLWDMFVSRGVDENVLADDYEGRASPQVIDAFRIAKKYAEVAVKQHLE